MLAEHSQEQMKSNVVYMETREDSNVLLHDARLVLTEYRDLLSVEDLAKIFGVSKQTIYKELRDGKFGKPIQIGRAYKVSKIFVAKNFITNNNY